MFTFDALFVINPIDEFILNHTHPPQSYFTIHNDHLMTGQPGKGTMVRLNCAINCQLNIIFECLQKHLDLDIEMGVIVAGMLKSLPFIT